MDTCSDENQRLLKYLPLQDHESSMREQQQQKHEHEYQTDWWEVEPKTGYTYVETPSYSPQNARQTWSTPNMSRPALRSYGSAVRASSSRHSVSSIESSAATTSTQEHMTNNHQESQEHSHLYSSPLVTGSTSIFSNHWASANQEEEFDESELNESNNNLSSNNNRGRRKSTQRKSPPKKSRGRKSSASTSAHGEVSRHVLRSGNRYGPKFESGSRSPRRHVSFEDETEVSVEESKKLRGAPRGRNYVLKTPLYGIDDSDEEEDDSDDSDIDVRGCRSPTFTVMARSDRFMMWLTSLYQLWRHTPLTGFLYVMSASIFSTVMSAISTLVTAVTSSIAVFISSIAYGTASATSSSVGILSRHMYHRTVNTVINESWSLLSWLGLVEGDQEMAGRKGVLRRRSKTSQRNNCCGIPIPCLCCLVMLPLILLMCEYFYENWDELTSAMSSLPLFCWFFGRSSPIFATSSTVPEGGLAGGARVPVVPMGGAPVIGGLALTSDELDDRIKAIVDQVYRDHDKDHNLRAEKSSLKHQQQLDALSLTLKQQLEALELQMEQNHKFHESSLKAHELTAAVDVDAKIAVVAEKSQAMLSEIAMLRAEIANGDSNNNDRINQLREEFKELKQHKHMHQYIRNEIDSRLNAMLMGCGNASGCEADSGWSPFAAWLEEKFREKDSSWEARIDAAAADLTARLAHLNATCCKDADSLAAVIAAANARAESSRPHSHPTGSSGGWAESMLSPEQSQQVSKLIHDALLVYGADKIGKVDYALESGGGTIVSIRCTETYSEAAGLLSMFGIPLMYISNSPRTVIQPSVQRGECWPFKGAVGFLVIKLAMPIHPTSFTIEHLPRHMSPDGRSRSAPKDFAVLGLESEHDPNPLPLGNYTYMETGEPLQTFAIQARTARVFQMVELQILSNWGNLKYTCLYRFRVHGRLPKDYGQL